MNPPACSDGGSLGAGQTACGVAAGHAPPCPAMYAAVHPQLLWGKCCSARTPAAITLQACKHKPRQTTRAPAHQLEQHLDSLLHRRISLRSSALLARRATHGQVGSARNAKWTGAVPAPCTLPLLKACSWPMHSMSRALLCMQHACAATTRRTTGERTHQYLFCHASLRVVPQLLLLNRLQRPRLLHRRQLLCVDWEGTACACHECGT